MSDTAQSGDRSLPIRIARRLPYARRFVRYVRAWWENWRRQHERSAKIITRKNTVRAYNRVYRSDRFLGEYLRPERCEFYEEFVEKCVPLKPQRIIDVGCGTGHLLRILLDRLAHNPEIVVGLDRARAGIRRVHTLVPEAQGVVADLYRLPAFKTQFDLVLCVEVLEHVREPLLAVKVLRTLCAPQGRVAITVPDGAEDTWEGHLNFWAEEELRAFLQPEGLLELERIQDGEVLLAWLGPKSEPAKLASPEHGRLARLRPR